MLSNKTSPPKQYERTETNTTTMVIIAHNNENNRTAADNRTAKLPAESNDLAAPSGHGQSRASQHEPRRNDHFFHHQLERQEATTKLLSRRLDLLEFELRKTILLLHHQMRIKSVNEFASSSNNINNNYNNHNNHNKQQQTSQAADDSQQQTINKSQLPLEALADLSSRLELMEKFITVTTKKVSRLPRTEFFILASLHLIDD